MGVDKKAIHLKEKRNTGKDDLLGAAVMTDFCLASCAWSRQHGARGAGEFLNCSDVFLGDFP